MYMGVARGDGGGWAEGHSLPVHVGS